MLCSLCDGFLTSVATQDFSSWRRIAFFRNSTDQREEEVLSYTHVKTAAFDDDEGKNAGSASDSPIACPVCRKLKTSLPS